MASTIRHLQLANQTVVSNTGAGIAGDRERPQGNCASCARNSSIGSPPNLHFGSKAFPRHESKLVSKARVQLHGICRRNARVLVPCAQSGGSEGQGDDPAANAEGSDWREFRARLLRTDVDTWGKEGKAEQKPSTWAHPITRPEAGCVLLAHPSAFGVTQTYFRQSVIFLFNHSERGCAGVILNKPLDHTLGALGGFEDLMPEFENSRLYMGGDVGRNSIHVLHGIQSLPGGRLVVPGIHVGGYASARDHVCRGLSNASDYRWFARYAGWGAGQLEKEVQAGVWFLASTSNDLILKHTTNTDIPLWREILELMGGKYSDIARHTYGEI